MIDISKVPSPCFVVEEDLLRRNLAIIADVKQRAGVDIILAFKAYALWKTFPIIREYVGYTTASSVAEAQLAFEEMGSPAHTYAPAYSDEEFPTIMQYSSHITFNSISQFERFYPQIQTSGKNIECGLRVNPEFSLIETDLYNPSAPGSRLGVIAEKLENGFPQGITGLHIHNLCENNSYDLEKLLQVVDKKFGHLFNQINWLNLGGGHLMTHKEYDVEHLISVLQSFKLKYPHLQIILEPGSAFAWETGVLIATVIDIVENHGIKTAMLNVSFACHMPDTLEMPYKPRIRGAYHEAVEEKPTYRMGGNSCLSGDFMGDWSFDEPLRVGDRIVFEDMIHYTMVKTTTFNGIKLPSIVVKHDENNYQIIKNFGYNDYKMRLS